MKIQTVCGFGCGSSLMLKMKLEEVLKKQNVEAELFCGDVGTCLSNKCDAIFISEDLYSRIADRATMPVIPIRNFMSTAEITEKTIKFLEEYNS